MQAALPIRGATAATSPSTWAKSTRWHIYYQDSEPQCTDLTYSEDGNVWYSLSAGVPFTPVLSDNWKWFKFKRTVKARYIRVYVGLVTGWTSMNEAEIYGPAN